MKIKGIKPRFFRTNRVLLLTLIDIIRNSRKYKGRKSSEISCSKQSILVKGLTMKNKIFTSLLIAAVINYFFGCAVSKTEKIPPELYKGGREVISSAVMINMEVIEFDKKGARFTGVSTVFAGKADDGTQLILPINEIKQVRTTIVPPVNMDNLNYTLSEIKLKNNLLVIYNSERGLYKKKSNSVIGTTDENKPAVYSLEQISEVYIERPETISIEEALSVPQKVRQVVTFRGEVVSFDSSGAVVTYTAGSVIGLTESGEFVNLHQDSILYYNVMRPDVAGSILATVVVYALAAVAVFVLIGIIQLGQMKFKF
jgi:hypothetical protein